jgi:hypothetical protein
MVHGQERTVTFSVTVQLGLVSSLVREHLLEFFNAVAACPMNEAFARVPFFEIDL